MGKILFQCNIITVFEDFVKVWSAYKFPCPLTFDFLVYQVEGVEGIMAAYSSALHNVALAGPTLFGPVINTAAQIAGHSLSLSQDKYFILLIITVSRVSMFKLTYLLPSFFPAP